MFKLSEKDKADLLLIARSVLEKWVREKMYLPLAGSTYSEKLHQKHGAFVSLDKGKILRGCIGRFNTNAPLYKLIKQLTISSANDSRFKPVAAKELRAINIEISVLSPLQKIHSYADIEIGKHGLLIEKGNCSGTLLPHIPVENAWSLKDFLGYCARDKAGLGWYGWKDADIFIYEAIVFSEKNLNAN